MANFKPALTRRTNPEPLGDIMKLFVVSNRLGYGLFNQEVSRAWDEASGAARYTTNRFYREGILHVTIKSSLIRNQLSFQRDLIVAKMNEILEESEMVRVSCIKERISKIVLH